MSDYQQLQKIKKYNAFENISEKFKDPLLKYNFFQLNFISKMKIDSVLFLGAKAL